MGIFGIFVCVLIVAMDVGAGILCIEAEFAKHKVHYMKLGSMHCGGHSNEAFKLGLGAAALLVLTHVTLNLIGSCTCICCPEKLEIRSSANIQLWFACLIFSWIIAAVGLPALIIGMVEIFKSRGSCSILHHHFLTISGILCFVHGIFYVAFYILTTVYFAKENNSGNESH